MSSSSTTSTSSISLPSLFARALEHVTGASKYLSIDDQAQALLQSSLADLKTLSTRIQALSLFSSNETLDDVVTKDLVYMFVPYQVADIEGRIRTSGPDDRIKRVRESERHLRTFIQQIDDYDIIPPDEKQLFGKNAGSDPTQRREIKIKQFQKEKEIKDKITALRARKGLPEVDMYSEFGLIASLLPSNSEKGRQRGSQDEDDEDEDEDYRRELILLALRLIWSQAVSQLKTVDEELSLLQSAPMQEDWCIARDKAEQTRGGGRSSDDTWKLDRPLATGGPDGKGPLLDSKGKVMRPFTILPSGMMSERERLQAEVFRPDHRLPTMTMDEYIEEERRRGNIISGGGPASEMAPTSSEQLAIDSEQDGTLFGEEKAEEQRQKDEKWAQYTDLNPKGAGNTMNRG